MNFQYTIDVLNLAKKQLIDEQNGMDKLYETWKWGSYKQENKQRDNNILEIEQAINELKNKIYDN